MAINASYTLDDVLFIGGSTKSFFFKVFDNNGLPLDLNGATCTWKLRRYGDFGDSALLTKVGIITALNEFKILLISSDTESLYGKFIQQPVVQDFAGKKYFPAQGVICIEQAIP